MPGPLLVDTLGSIPSPATNRIGPFTAYGLMIAIGVIAGVWLARRRWEDRGGDPEDMTTIALWAVPAGLIGARLYHVITDNQKYRAPQGEWIDAFKIWQGGLGIPGGILLGVVVGVYVAHRKGIRLGPGLDTIAPCLPLAQAIGRLGNYFNQELYGRPTDLPWGLQIGCEHRSGTEFSCVDYPAATTFHPTFLYELTWNLALVGLLIWLDKKRVIRPGRLFALYVGGYFLGRLWVESLRSDTANTILGLRVNIWISVLCITAVILVFAFGGVKRREDDSDEPYRDGHRYRPPGSWTVDPADGEPEVLGESPTGRSDAEPGDQPDAGVADAADDGPMGRPGDDDRNSEGVVVTDASDGETGGPDDRAGPSPAPGDIDISTGTDSSTDYGTDSSTDYGTDSTDYSTDYSTD